VSGTDGVPRTPGGDTVKFLLSIYGNEEKWGSIAPDDLAELIAGTDAHNTALVESGELLGAFGTSEPVNVKRVRNTDAGPVVTDGPYIESKEYLGSFYIVDCESLDRALEIAAGMPSAALADIEVWPLMHGGTADEL
jgi:hypothetical protein